MGNRWKRTTLDGLGRTIRVETGHDSVTVSTVDTQYAPCACSPLGKLWRVSQPYAPGATVYWTTYTYDASGRTLTVTAPDGASTTHYAYQGNQTTVTDPAGKWKTHTTDAFGNLVTVAEPDPGGGANLTTNYAYNGANQLTSVTMAAQVRTFTWSGQDLASATNPENGTVTYAYDGAHRVTSRTDAKGQQTQYTYDTYGRVTEVRHYPTGWSNDDANQRWDYYYDSNPFDSGGYSTYTWGRLAAVQFGSVTGYPTQYMYSYNVAGRVTGQRLSAQLPASWYIPNSPIDLRASYAWDNEGRMTSQAYPWPLDWMDLNSSGTITFGYQYDSMGRLGAMNGDQGDGNGVIRQRQLWPGGGTARPDRQLPVLRLFTPFLGDKDVQQPVTGHRDQPLRILLPRHRRQYAVRLLGHAEQRADRAVQRWGDRRAGDLSIRLAEPAGARRDGQQRLGRELPVRPVWEPDGEDAHQGVGAGVVGDVRRGHEPADGSAV